MSELTTFYPMTTRLHSTNINNNKLAIILPGANYTHQAPLLHFSSNLLTSCDYDLLHIDYKLTKEQLETFDSHLFANDVSSCISSELQNNVYDDFVIVAKSIGTLAVDKLLPLTNLKTTKIVYLTPLLQNDDVYRSMIKSNYISLSIIGSADHCYIDERFNNLSQKNNFTQILIDHADHSLQLSKQPLLSIDILKDVIHKISLFIDVNK